VLQTVHLVNVENLWRFDLDADLIEERMSLEPKRSNALRDSQTSKTPSTLEPP
jgi:hypothetical protein